ncbi:MAG: hypothetical protein QOE58_1848, partial [Actinomycetota bacterium]|nr:hypothetical protein [Actinomycetota bacterium]
MTPAQPLSPAKKALLAQLLSGRAAPLLAAAGPQRSDVLPARVPLTPAQERIWLAEQLAGPTALFTIGYTATEEDLDEEQAQRLLTLLLNRHAALRSRVSVDESGPYITFRPQTDFRVEMHPMGARDDEKRSGRLEQVELDWLTRAFDLNADPLLAMCLVTFPDAPPRLIVAIHHLVVDGASLLTIMLESHGGTPPSGGVDYPDIALWEASDQRRTHRERQVSAAADRLKSAPSPVHFPLDLAPPKQPSYRAGIQDLQLTDELTDRVRQLARDVGSTDQAVLL